jgi:hypothetical protein
VNLPNLASRPLLNSRPVWVVTAVAGFLALIFVALNVNLYFHSSEAQEEQSAMRRRLITESRELRGELADHIRALEGVRWSALGSRVAGLNLVLRSHSFSWLDLLSDIEGILPWNVRLIRVAPNMSKEGVTLDINGTAQTRDSWLEMIENLIDDPRFENPIPRDERLPEGSPTSGYSFTLAVTYLPSEEGS